MDLQARRGRSVYATNESRITVSNGGVSLQFSLDSITKKEQQTSYSVAIVLYTYQIRSLTYFG